ncbi:hypothetical protein ABZ208_09525 [Streptomyces sp. NPDC006208]|uniref:hypothetical protein n=1 Tax=Streptomyces sp. NPDC006208 TaxID=3156734 RepID=UPI0033A60986
MGWTVLYIAFGIVALWLLGEVLLQYKARLRYRLLAFAGFLGVVLGVLMPSVLVIALGAIAFAIGQTYVTLSFRRGFSTGWALGGGPGVSRRRKMAPPRDGAAMREPTLEVSDLTYEPDDEAMERTDPGEQGEPEVYQTRPMPEDTGEYGIYTADAYTAERERSESENYAQYSEGYAAYDAYGDYGQQQPAPAPEGQYDYGQQQYAAYADPYAAGGQQYNAYGTYDGYGGQQQYAQPADPYAQQQYYETPPGGVWVPQQREGEQYVPPMPQDQPSQYDYDAYNEQQYRF